MNETERILALQREYRDEYARAPHPQTMRGIEDAVMEETLMAEEDSQGTLKLGEKSENMLVRFDYPD